MIKLKQIERFLKTHKLSLTTTSLIAVLHILFIVFLFSLKGLEAGSKSGKMVMVAIDIAPPPEVTKSVVSPKVVEKKILAQKDDAKKADFVVKKKQKPKPKPKPKPPKPKLSKPKPKVEPKPMADPPKTVGDGGKLAEKSEFVNKQGISQNASLGAGFGLSMGGKCSSVSDDADDEGEVKVRVIIAPNGEAKEVVILSSSGIKRLDRQAKKIAKSHRFQPARKNGKAVEGSVVFTIHFQCGNA